MDKVKIRLRSHFLALYSPEEKFQLIISEQGKALEEISSFHSNELGINKDTALDNLYGAIKFMIACGVQGKKMTLPKDEDDARHQFICFTKHYQFICKNYIGYFVHHNPCPKAEAESYFEYSIQRMKKVYQTIGFNQQLRLTQGAQSCSGCCD